jgi:hypothetical protein
MQDCPVLFASFSSPTSCRWFSTRLMCEIGLLHTHLDGCDGTQGAQVGGAGVVATPLPLDDLGGPGLQAYRCMRQGQLKRDGKGQGCPSHCSMVWPSRNQPGVCFCVAATCDCAESRTQMTAGDKVSPHGAREHQHLRMGAASSAFGPPGCLLQHHPVITNKHLADMAWQTPLQPTCSMRLLKRALSCFPRHTDWKATAALRTRRKAMRLT